MRTAPGKLARRVALVLRWGSYLAAFLLLAGVVWVVVASDVPIQAGPPMPLGAMGGQLADRNPYAVIQLGILFLLATPLLRIVVTAACFWGEGERRYTLVSLAVLGIIVVSLLLAR